MAQTINNEVYFHEVQRFGQWWVWLIVLGIAAFQWWVCWEQLIMGRPFGDNPMPNGLLIAFCVVFGIGLPWLFLAAKLVAEVRGDGVFLRFFPFHFGTIRIPLSDVVSFSAGKYSPLADYGGWGIRIGRGGKAYNVSGNMGVRLALSDGTHLLIGSRHAEELAAAIAKAQEAGGAESQA